MTARILLFKMLSLTTIFCSCSLGFIAVSVVMHWRDDKSQNRGAYALMAASFFALAGFSLVTSRIFWSLK